MAVRRIIRMGHPHLRTVAEPVPTSLIGTDEFNNLVQDMTDTLHDYGGIGLAAPQIDVPLRLALIDIPGGPSRYGELQALPLMPFINPEISILDDARAGYWEGCLSIPGMRGYVERSQHIRVDYTDMSGAPGALELEGFLATVFQHEFDHLDGRLYVDRMEDMGKLVFDEEFLRYWEEGSEGV